MIALADTAGDFGQDRDLAWLAFRYVCGDQGEAQAAVFERRLGRDQAAREAVAEAVLIAGAVTPAEVSRRKFHRSRRRGFLTMAAGFFFVAFTLHFSGNGPGRLISPMPPSAPDGTLALAWWGLTQDGGNAVDLPDDLTPSEPSAPDELDTPPAWLVEAAALPAANPSSENRGT